VPNLIIRFGTCKVGGLNQLGSTDLYLGRPAVLFDGVCLACFRLSVSGERSKKRARDERDLVKKKWKRRGKESL